MLKFLDIRDFVIVDRIDLEFAPGFTVLTGETGAGKSILIDALSLVLGERSDASAVRNGCERAEISAEFEVADLPDVIAWLHENGFENQEEEGVCLLRRLVDAGGRSRSFINGNSATLQQLRAIGENLVDIQGQHVHQSMLRSEVQRELLDSYAGSKPLARQVAEAYRRWQTARQQREAWEQNAAAFAREREELEWQVNELSTLNFSNDEWESLQAEHSRLSNAASLLATAQAGLEALSEGEFAVLSQINSVISRLHQMVDYDQSLKAVLDLLEPGQIQLQEAVYELGRYQQRLELDPQRLSEVEERLAEIHTAARKYRVTPEELPELLKGFTERLQALGHKGDGESLAREEAVASSEYNSLAKKLTIERSTAASTLSQQVTAAMQTLAMAGGEFSVALLPLEQGTVHGLEQIEFQVAAHKTLPLRPLAKVASGGELSRIGLAISVITAKLGTVPTLIFDEVDVGIGGRVAEIVGTLLKRLGRERQVLCITHLAQVASAGDNQWRVSKSADSASGGKVTSRIVALDSQERVEEIARMLGGTKITDTTRSHAAEMLLSAGEADGH
ncbi:DNA replication and repair protein RecN [Nitrosospira multiformis]|uniref:DNA repair protein RecN n=1 Tax=Nitrosospira multiformis TaxID=1231 RepID=A0A1I0C687_9PROT|nr:DNA repair protein RecN [Nitrosospira multiformis]SET14438.1 DNA replication and repair protein RecN [Nitrosospira multiformis]